MGAKVIQVIETNLERRGTGKDESSPIRGIRQYWTTDGELLAEVDPCPTSPLLIRPVAWRVKRCDGQWIIFLDEAEAIKFADTTEGGRYQGLYVRDGK